ncbi:3-hydroxyacyl-CoA dehydrogenase family protein [Aneurinibacillus sp. REN35]|uniref:3-hydroxyacyl-CoA dehydrogenase family protein n=1 Tax=Aneurinibacillus sp. REN35 TaxID=3237286 RepID=UPI00352705A7
MTYYHTGVVGAGTMGAGIALVCLRAGHTVYLADTSKPALEKAKEYIEKMLAKDVSKQKITEEKKQKLLEAASFVSDMSELCACDIVIEAVSERLELKKSIFASLVNHCRPDTLLLTNTSSYSITEIAAGLSHPERIIGFHFFNPAPVMPLIEVIRGKYSGDREVNRTCLFAEQLGKVPVLVTDSPGFIVNRVARPYYNEALRIYGDRIAKVEQIDRIMTQAGGFKMGPFELQDMIGIDINYATTESLYTNFFHESRFKPSRIQRQMVQAGALGRKTREGFYSYDE